MALRNPPMPAQCLGKTPWTKWSGLVAFAFSLNFEPQAPRIGWRCGYGRWSRDPKNGRVDLALCLPKDRMKYNVHGNHIFFNFLSDSAAFAIHVLHPTIVDGEMVTSSKHGDRNYRVLNKTSHVVSIGEMSYTFNYTIPSGQVEAFAKRRTAYMRDIMSIEVPPISHTPTPSEEDIHLGRWRLVQTIGSGTESVIASAISRDGELVAVKEIGAKRSVVEKRAKIEKYKSICAQVEGEGARYLIAFYGSIDSKLGVTYTFFRPLARYDFTSLLDGSIDTERPILGQLFLQAMKGVGALHNAGFMHRDLKPANLGVCSMNPPHAVVLDLGSSVYVGEKGDLTPSPGCFGSIGFIAPEVENIKARYGTPADIWSMGCVGLQLLILRHSAPYLPWRMPGSPNFNPWRSIESFTRAPLPNEDKLEEQRMKYKDVLQGLSSSEDVLEDVLCCMLLEAPHWRYRADEVINSLSRLTLTTWSEVRTSAKA